MFSTDPRDIIHQVTRGDLLADGSLIDVTETARGAGFRVPVAVTVSAWADCVAWADEDNTRKGTIQDEAGRLWDVVWVASRAARRADGGGTVSFQLLRVPREGRGRTARLVTLEMTSGPGDDGEHVITISMPGEN